MEAPPTPPFVSLTQSVLYVVASSALLGVGSLITLFATRLMSRSEIKAGAEESKAKVRASDGNLLRDAWERLDQLQEVIDELRAALLIAEDEKHRMTRLLEDKESLIRLQQTQLGNMTTLHPGTPPFEDN